MKINKTNYESWFLDYYEGTLSAENSAELFLFLEQYPKLKEEFENVELMFLSDSDTTTNYPDKESLKRKTIPDADTIQEWLIAEMEGDLNLQERSALLTFLANHPQFQSDRDLYSKTLSQANLSEIFPNKSKLRKRGLGAPTNLRVYYAIAASLILLIGAWTILKFMNPKHQIETAHKEKGTNQQINSEKPEISNSQQERKLANEFPASSDESKNSNQKKVNLNPTTQNKISKEQKLADQSNLNKNSNHRSVKNKNISTGSTPKQEKVEILSTTKSENIAFIAPRSTPILTELEPFVFAERRYVPGAEQNENNFANLQPEILLNELKDKAAVSVNKVTGEELLATNGQTPKLPAKSRLIQLAAWSLNKVSSNRINLKTEFNPNNGKLAAYVLEVGKKKWQRISDF